MTNRIQRWLVLLGLLYSTGSNAQTASSGTSIPPPMTSDSKGNPLRELREALSGLSPARIPTSVLLDRVLPMTRPERFAGQGDTAASYRGFEQQYWEFYHAALDSSSLPTLATIRTSIGQRVEQGVVPLVMLSYSYNEFLPDAATQQLITIDSVNARVTDGPDLSRSPYATKRLFSVVLPVAATGSNMAVYVGPEFWLGNTPAPSYLTIDFGDGMGPQYVSMGSTVQVQVPSGDLLRTTSGQLPVVGLIGPLVRVTNPHTGLIAAASMQQAAIASLPPDLALGLVASRQWGAFQPSYGISGPNGRASAIAWIKYAPSNTARKLRKPLVFVEGIDFERFRNGNLFAGPNQVITQTGPLPLSSFTQNHRALGGYRNGSAGWNEMVDYNKEYKSLEKFPQLRAQLQSPPNPTNPAAGGGDYDIIYLDFSDGASLIQHNAMVLAELLEWINKPENRTPDAEETMVIGTSMGGQVARFALAWMEQQRLCHNSKLYISFDSPHRGANVPIGIQHMFDRLQGAWIGDGAAERVVNNQLMREASMQMLNFHFSWKANALRNGWQAWQATPDSYPSLMRKVAVANGSGQAVTLPGLQPGVEILYSARQRKVIGRNTAYALPGGSHEGHHNVVFRYRKAYSLSGNWRYSYADQNWGPYDSAPGSTSDVADVADDQSDGVLRANHKFNTFMSTLSALDVRDAGGYNNPNFGYDIKQQIPFNTLPNRFKYSFDAYFSAEGVNEPHVQITTGQASTHGNAPYLTDNANWMRNELQQSAHRLPARLAYGTPTETYNYASIYRHLLPSVSIDYQGLLTVHDPARPVDGGDPLLPQTRHPAGNFELYTGSCATVVKVTYGGRLQLGSPSNAAYTASLRMAANSLLDVSYSGQVDINPGSVLRVSSGATLVVRSGARLNVQGQLIVEKGAYLCVEDPASIMVSGAGAYSPSVEANYFANPALGLGTLACRPLVTAPLSVAITSLVYKSVCTSSSNRNNYAEWTATPGGGSGNGTYAYAWYLDYTGTNNFQGPYGDGGPVFGKCLNGYEGRVVQVKVVVSSAGQQASAVYYGQSQLRVAMYPNPATSSVDFTAQDEAAGPAAHPAGPAPAAAFHVGLYDGQGQLRWEGSTRTGQLRLDSRRLPRGLYGVVITKDGVVSRHHLSLQ